MLNPEPAVSTSSETSVLALQPQGSVWCFLLIIASGLIRKGRRFRFPPPAEL